MSAARSYADDVTYQRPVKAVASFVGAAPLTRAELGPDRAALLLITPLVFPSIAEVSAPEVRLTGTRVNARNVLWEQVRWLDTYVKHARPRPTPRLTTAPATGPAGR